jgi:hypothetical protein
VVIFVTLTILGVPFPLLWALWVGAARTSVKGFQAERAAGSREPFLYQNGPWCLP